MDRLNEASAKLNDHVPVGTMERWENPQSGNRGTVALIGTAEKDGHPCLKIRHNIKIKGVAEPKVYIFNRCRMPDGSWKLF
jgi:surface antigen